MGTAYEFEVKRGAHVANYVLSSQGISRASRYRRKAVKWHQIQTLWNLKQSFLLFYSDTSYWVIPQDQVPDDAREYIMEQVHSVGVRIKTLGE